MQCCAFLRSISGIAALIIKRTLLNSSSGALLDTSARGLLFFPLNGQWHLFSYLPLFTKHEVVYSQHRYANAEGRVEKTSTISRVAPPGCDSCTTRSIHFVRRGVMEGGAPLL